MVKKDSADLMQKKDAFDSEKTLKVDHQLNKRN